MKKNHSLDELRHSAECLEHGRKAGISGRISVVNIGKFFDRIADDEESTLEGRFLLAQQGADCAKAEKIIGSLFMMDQAKTSENTTNSDAPHPLHTPRTAIEQVEHLRFQETDLAWHSLIDQTLEEIGMMAPESVRDTRPFDPSRAHDSSLIFKKDANEIHKNSSRATIYAEHMKDFTSSYSVINDSLEALAEITANVKPCSKLQTGFFKAFHEIFSDKIFEDKSAEDIGHLATTPEGISAMVRGSLRFMQEQFRNEFFSKKQTVEAIDDYVSEQFPDAVAPWAHIWIAIRAGLYDLVPKICKLHVKETEVFLDAFNKYVVKDDEPPTAEMKVKLCENSISINDHFKQQVIHFTVSQELTVQSDVIRTAEDYVFSMINYFRFTTADSTFDYSFLENIQENIRQETNRVFADQKDSFIIPLILLLSLNFSGCGNALIDCKTSPCEIVHAIIALKAWNLWYPSELFDDLVNDFVHLLPPQMCGRAVDYLTFTGNHKYLANYILELDPYDETLIMEQSRKIYPELMLDGRDAAIELIKKEIEDLGTTPSERIFRLLLTSGDLLGAYNMLVVLDEDYSVLTLRNVCSMIKLEAILIAKITKFNQDRLMINVVQHSGFKLMAKALSQVEGIGLAEREELVNNCKMFLKTLFADTPEEVEAINTIRALLHISQVMTLVDSGNVQEAVQLANEAPHIIPTRQNQINQFVTWINTQPNSIIIAIRSLLESMLKKIINLVGENNACVETLSSLINDVINEDILHSIKQRDFFATAISK